MAAIKKTPELTCGRAFRPTMAASLVTVRRIDMPPAPHDFSEVSHGE